MKENKPKSTRFWMVSLALLLLVALIGMWFAHSHRETGAMVQVVQNGETVDTFPLNKNGSHRYESASGGYNLVEILDGKVAVIEASCPDQICVKHGPTDQTADPIVCLPNKLVVQVISLEGETGQLDGVSS